MAYEILDDVRVVALGGINKRTGKKNPTELEGYYVGAEKRPNKFNPSVPKNFYVFKTKNGEEGIYGSGGIDQSMKRAQIGAMTKIVDTGETKDVGKGNPMRIFTVMQDRTNTIEVNDSPAEESSLSSESFDDSDDSAEDSYGSTASFDEVEPARPVAPKAPAKTNPSAAMALLKARQKTTG